MYLNSSKVFSFRAIFPIFYSNANTFLEI